MHVHDSFTATWSLLASSLSYLVVNSTFSTASPTVCNHCLMNSRDPVSFQDTALRTQYWHAHQPPLASRSGAHPVQDRRNDLPSSERQCTSVSVVILHPCRWRAISAETPVGFLQQTCCTAPFNLSAVDIRLFHFPAPTDGTVLHRRWNLRRRSRFSDNFSFTCHIQT